MTFGTPRLGGNYGAGPYRYYQIVQTPGYVGLTMEFDHEARIIPLDGRPHLPQHIRQWSGDSRGRWEGNALVVDTTNFSPKSTFMGSAENLHMVERFTRVAADTIDYEMTLDDPTTWTKPWTAVIRLKRTEEKIYEVACHEGNHYSMQGILAGARADEKAAEEDSPLMFAIVSRRSNRVDRARFPIFRTNFTLTPTRVAPIFAVTVPRIVHVSRSNRVDQVTRVKTSATQEREAQC